MKASRKTEQQHAERVARKYERLEMMRALIATWEKDPRVDQEYLRELHRKAHNLQTQLGVMS